MVHVITTIERGGAENAIAGLAQIQVNKGYKVFIVPLKGNLELLESLQASGVQVDTSLISKSFLSQVLCMRRRYKDPHIFHAHLPRAELLLRFSKPKSGFYVTRHNTERFFPKSNSLFSKRLSRFVLQKSLGVISISKAVRDYLLNSKEISSRTPNCIIHYGYTERIKRSRNVKLVLNDDIRVLRLGTIGRLAPQKNLIMLIEFANLLRDVQIDFQIQIAGEGPERNRIEDKLHDEQLEQEVQLLGKISDVSSFLTSQDFFIFTSNYEGLGLVLLEAMDAGLPIIAPRNSAIPEVIGEYHPGLFVSGDLNSLFTTFMAMFRSPAIQRQALQVQSLRLLEFNMENYFNSHHDFYDNVEISKQR